MLIMAIVVLDTNKLGRMTYPTDMAGRHCTLDHPEFNFLYFTSPTDPVHLNLKYRESGSVYHSVQLAHKKSLVAGQLTSFRVIRIQV